MALLQDVVFSNAEVKQRCPGVFCHQIGEVFAELVSLCDKRSRFGGFDSAGRTQTGQ